MGQGVQFGQRLLDRAGALRGGFGDVVPDHEFAFRLHARDQLVQLEGEEAAVRAEFEHVLGDLRGDPADHLQALGHGRDVPDRHQVLDLQRGEGARDLVQTELVALQGRQGLVRAGQDRRRVLQDAALAVDVQGDEAHRLGDRDHREADLLAHPVRGAVPGARLLRRDRRVGHELHARPKDLRQVRREHDAAVQLAQLTQARGRELDVQDETARAHRLHRLVEAQHDESAGVAAQHPLGPSRRGCRGPRRSGRRASGHRHRRSHRTFRELSPGRWLPLLSSGRGVLGPPMSHIRFVRTGETRAKSTGGPPRPGGPPADESAEAPSGRPLCPRLPGPSCRPGSCRDRPVRARA